MRVSDGLHANYGLSLCILKSMGYISRLISWITASPLELDGSDVPSRLHCSAVRGCVKVAGYAEGHCLAQDGWSGPDAAVRILHVHGDPGDRLPAFPVLCATALTWNPAGNPRCCRTGLLWLC